MQTTERLAQLIEKKHHVLTQLREVGHRQAALICDGDTGTLLKLLAAKQHLIMGLQNLERELVPYYSNDPEQRNWASPQARAACAQQAAECNGLLDEILKLEKQGADEMTTRRNAVAEQLQQVHTAGHVRSAYEAHRRASV
jgi:hypothetical protein